MGFGSTLVLGAIAGSTILLGLPLGRMRRPAASLRLVLNAVAIGVLLFLFWDVLAAAFEPLDNAVVALHDGTGGAGPAIGYTLLFAGGLTVGLMSLVYYERYMGRVRSSAGRRFGPGAMAVGELDARRGAMAGWTPARRLAMLIAVGIGLHNFAEGLAIGGSAADGKIGLATLLVIGFALHNGTEGFGIVAPLAADRADGEGRPSWGFLLLLGLVAGGPTFVGTAVGHQLSSNVLSVAFLTLAAGSILYVVVQLLSVAAKAGRKELLCWGLLAGLMAGFLTDLVVSAAGA